MTENIVERVGYFFFVFMTCLDQTNGLTM